VQQTKLASSLVNFLLHVNILTDWLIYLFIYLCIQLQFVLRQTADNMLRKLLANQIQYGKQHTINSNITKLVLQHFHNRCIIASFCNLDLWVIDWSVSTSVETICRTHTSCWHSVSSSRLRSVVAAEVDSYRVELEDIKVRGKHCPKPIKTWAQCGVSKKELDCLKKSVSFVSKLSLVGKLVSKEID